MSRGASAPAANSELVTARRRLDSAMIAAEVGTFEWDIVGDRLYGDQNFERLFGVRTHADGTAPLNDFVEAIHPDDRASTLAMVQHSVETGEPFEAEYRIISGDRVRWVHVRGKVEHDDTGRAARFPGVLIDITARKHAEQERNTVSNELRRLASIHETILSATDDFAYVFDRQGRFLYANRRLLTVWAKTLDQIVGKTCLELGYPDWHAAMHMREIEQVIATRQPIRGEVPFTGDSGISGFYDYIFTPVFDARDEVEVIAGTTRDITERKRAEQELKRARDEALAASRAKDDFLAALSHELRTPLNPVLLVASEAASDPTLSPEVRAAFATVRKNTELEARLIDDLLDLTSITRGKLLVRKETLEVHAVLHDAIAALRAEFREKQLVLQVRLEATCPSVHADGVRLLQVFSNLLKNALKFTAERGEVSVETRDSAEGIEIRVVDTGIGMTAQEIERIFEPFAQGDHASMPGSSRFGGLGVGLAIARKLIQAHSGGLEARSAGRGSGSTFVVRLPRAEASIEPVRPAAPATAGGELSRIAAVRRRVLLVEDHEPTRATLASLLQRRNFDVLAAGSLAEARAAVLNQRVDLVISDIGLPDGSGTELMAELRERHGLKGIALTGYGMADDIARCLTAGFVTHLTKPVRIESLEAALATTQ